MNLSNTIMEIQSIQVNDLHVSKYPQSSKSDNILLFIHGAWHSSFYWEKYWIPYFQSKGYSCCTFDLRSHGKSKSKGSFRFTSINDYVNDLQFVINELKKNYNDIIPLAHSMGGLIVQKYLAKHDNEISKAILLAPAMSWGVRAFTYRSILHHPLQYIKMNITLSPKSVTKNFKIYKETFFYSETDDKLLKEYQSQAQNESYRAIISMLLNQVKFKEIKTPILIVGGRKDLIFSEKNLLKLTSKFTNAELLFFDETGHNMMLEKNWSTIADAIISWIKN